MDHAAPLEGPAARGVRRIGFALLLLASLLPYHGCIAHPCEFEDPPSSVDNYSRDTPAYRPLAAVEYDLRREWLREEGVTQEDLLILPGDWTSNDYGYALFFGVVPWLLVLGLARREGSRTRRITAIAVFVLWGPVLYGLLPTQRGISWEGHVFGFIGGIVAAWVLAGRPLRGGI